VITNRPEQIHTITSHTQQPVLASLMTLGRRFPRAAEEVV
jgi:hypothetical protein